MWPTVGSGVARNGSSALGCGTKDGKDFGRNEGGDDNIAMGVNVGEDLGGGHFGRAGGLKLCCAVV